MGRFILVLFIAFIVASGMGLISRAHGAELMAQPVQMQQRPECNERDNVLGLLGKKYGETVSAIGVTNTGGLVEVLNDPKDGSWTIIMTTPQGMSCLVAAGEGWRTMEEIKDDGPDA